MVRLLAKRSSPCQLVYNKTILITNVKECKLILFSILLKQLRVNMYYTYTSGMNEPYFKIISCQYQSSKYYSA